MPGNLLETVCGDPMEEFMVKIGGYCTLLGTNISLAILSR